MIYKQFSLEKKIENQIYVINIVQIFLHKVGLNKLNNIFHRHFLIDDAYNGFKTVRY